jgi:Kef-type K+ transport system membrane component KefB
VDVILQVFLIFVAAKAAAEVFVRLELPAIAGELLVGVILGPHVADAIQVNQSTRTLSDLGIVILLFTVGLETPLSGLLAVGRAALLTSAVGIFAAGVTGASVVMAFGHGGREAALVGTALAASSVGVAARVFQDIGSSATAPARVVLGAAVVDDVIALALFPLVLGFGGHGSSVGEAVIGVSGAVGFIVLVGVVGSRLSRRHPGLLDRPRVRRSPFVVSLTICLGLAAVAEQVGLAALVGAFLAGMVLAETSDRYELDRRMLPLFDFLVPFFFVLTGARMQPGRLVSGGLGMASILCVVTIVAKWAGCGVGAIGLGRKERALVGAGMIPRNEVTLVVASAAVADGALSADLFSVLVGVVLVTTLIGPTLMRAVLPSGWQRKERSRRVGEGPPEAAGADPGSQGP